MNKYTLKFENEVYNQLYFSKNNKFYLKMVRVLMLILTSQFILSIILYVLEPESNWDGIKLSLITLILHIFIVAFTYFKTHFLPYIYFLNFGVFQYILFTDFYNNCLKDQENSVDN